MDQALQHWQGKMAQFQSKSGILEIDVLRASRLANYFLAGARWGGWWIRPVDPLKSTILLD